MRHVIGNQLTDEKRYASKEDDKRLQRRRRLGAKYRKRHMEAARCNLGEQAVAVKQEMRGSK
jgi:hypothetical protein